MPEPSFTITPAKVISFATVLAALILIYTTTMSVLDNVATKADINALSKKVDIGFIDINIDANNSDLQRLDDITVAGNILTNEQTRLYNSIIESNKRLAARRERLLK